MVERLERHAGRDGAVTNHRHYAAILAALRSRHGHAQRCADRGTRVPDTESVVLAFRARRKWCKPTVLLDGVKLIAPSRKHLVRIGLVSHVPHQSVVRCVEDVVQRYGQFDGAQARSEMAPPSADALDQELAQFLGE